MSQAKKKLLGFILLTLARRVFRTYSFYLKPDIEQTYYLESQVDVHGLHGRHAFEALDKESSDRCCHLVGHACPVSDSSKLSACREAGKKKA